LTPALTPPGAGRYRPFPSDSAVTETDVLLAPTAPAAPVVSPAAPPVADVLGVRFHAGETDAVAARLVGWAEAGEARYACFSNAQSVIEAHDDPAFLDVLNGADLNVPDGMSIVRAMRAGGTPQADRAYGPDVTLAVCRLAATRGVPVALYGSSERVLGLLAERLPALAPGLRLVEAISPPFRALSADEDEAFVQRLRASGARIVLVGLGCPKQERWCADHVERVGAVLMAVGAAFDFHAGTLAQAPRWMQQAGLEWAFRLAMEPRRLWRRYARVVPRFLAARVRARLAGR